MEILRFPDLKKMTQRQTHIKKRKKLNKINKKSEVLRSKQVLNLYQREKKNLKSAHLYFCVNLHELSPWIMPFLLCLQETEK